MAGNRDEFHARPSAALTRWDDAPHILGGRDLQSGGTWLGVSEHGRFAVVTNIAGNRVPDPEKTSRGQLVVDVLAGAPLPDDPDGFNAFNLFAAGRDGAHLLTNRPAPAARPLAPGIHSLSNGIIGAPWPRRERLEAGLAAWLAGSDDGAEALFALLADESETQEPVHPPVFIRAPAYGTRASTVVIVDADGAGRIIERRFGPDGIALGETALDFHWP
jgi:uncharacterized protein with NRDE domain